MEISVKMAVPVRVGKTGRNALKLVETGSKVDDGLVMMVLVQKHFLNHRRVMKKDVGIKNCFEKDH